MCRLLSPCWHNIYIFFSTARPTIVDLPAPDTNTECALNWCAPSQVSLHQPSVGRRMGVCLFLESIGESSTVLEGHSWRSTAYCSVMQECTPVRCLMLLGWPQGVCDWKWEVRKSVGSDEWSKCQIYIVSSFFSCAYVDSPCTAAPPPSKLMLHQLWSNVHNVVHYTW